MKNHLLLFFVFSILVSFAFSQVSDTITGDLYFGLWRYGSLYKQPKKIVKWVENLTQNNKRDTLDKTSQNIVRIYDVLKREQMLYFPYVQIKLDNDSIIRLYLQKKEYKIIRKNKLQDLIDKDEKVRISVQVRCLADGLYYCNELLLCDRIKGKTSVRPTKFAIEDYPR